MTRTLHLTEITAGSAEVVDTDGRRVATLERRTLVRSGLRDAEYGVQVTHITETDAWSWTTSHPGSYGRPWHGAFPTRREALAALAEHVRG